MDLSTPGSDLFGVVEARLLRVIARRSEDASGRTIARQAEVHSNASAQRALARLVAIGLVDARATPSAILYLANREHVLWPVVEAVLEAPGHVRQRIIGVLDEHAPVGTSGALFGSVARGDSTDLSDIDLLLVFPDDADLDAREALIGALHDEIEPFSGNALQAFDRSISEVETMRLAGDPLIDSLRRDAVHLFGPDIRHLLRTRAA